MIIHLHKYYRKEKGAYQGKEWYLREPICEGGILVHRFRRIIDKTLNFAKENTIEKAPPADRLGLSWVGSSMRVMDIFALSIRKSCQSHS